jgi:hypothetical protein
MDITLESSSLNTLELLQNIMMLSYIMQYDKQFIWIINYVSFIHQPEVSLYL